MNGEVGPGGADQREIYRQQRFQPGFRQTEKQAQRQPDDPTDVGDRWIWRAMALPSRLRVLRHLSHERSEAEATVFLATCKACTDGCAPFCTRDQLPAYVAALIRDYQDLSRCSI